jgi:hypothetical protein
LIDMGKRKTTSEQTNKPVYGAEIEGAARTQQDAYNQSQPMINQAANDMTGASSDLFAQFRQGDPTIQAAQSTAQQMMQGGANPYIDDMLNISNNRVMNQMQAQNAVRGRTGGSDANGIIARALAENETGTRFNQFNQTENRRLQAAGLAPGLLAGSMLPAQMGAQLGQQGAMLPLQGALANSAGVGGLLGQYQNVKGNQTQSGGLLGQILAGMAQAGTMAAMSCDIRLKENIERIGETPAGLPLYRFDYIGGERGVIGPMAQEVAIMQPDALGPVIDGYMTVIPGALQ